MAGDAPAPGESEREAQYTLLSDVARLARACAGYLSDRAKANAGWRILYAIDVDIVSFYLAPEDQSSYAAVLHGEDVQTRQILARLLSTFIMRDLAAGKMPGEHGTDRGQLLIVPPHDKELGEMMFAVSAKVLDETKTATHEFETVASWHLRLADVDAAQRPQWLIDNAPTLVRLFEGASGPSAELRRFRELDVGRLINLDRFEPDNAALRAARLKLDSSVATFDDFAELCRAWETRLFAHKSPMARPPLVRQDARVMARLEWINHRLAEHRYAVVLITGTSSILKAADEYAVRDGGATTTFGALYVRHPLSFLADASFFATRPRDVHGTDVQGFSVVNWMNLIFPSALQAGAGTAVMDIQLLRSIEQSPRTQFPDLSNATSAAHPHGVGASMLNEWSTQVRSVSNARNLDSEGRTAAARQLLARLDTAANSVTTAQLRDELTSRMFESLNVLYTSSAWLGLWSRVALRPDYVRGIPALRFEAEYSPAQEYCRQVVRTMRRRATEGSGPPAFDIDNMYRALAQVDDSHYHSHLVHALAYATKGHWYATRTLCLLALKTAEELPPERKRARRGREAAYLLAVSERRLARRREDLTAARAYLRMAESLENPASLGELPPARDPRFESESMALAVAEINFLVFVEADRTTDAMRLLGAVLPQGSSMLRRVGAEPLDSVREWVIQQVTINVLNLAIVCLHLRLNLTPELARGVRQFLDLATHTLDRNQSNWDEIAEFVYQSGLAVFGTAHQRESAAQALRLIKRVPIGVAFDQARERAFRHVVERARSWP